MSSHRSKMSRVMMRLRRVIRNDQLILAILALVVGAAAGGGVVLFREGIGLVQTVFYGSPTAHLYTHVQGLQWWHVLAAPAAGGLMIGLLVYRFLPGRRNHGVADVIEAGALHSGRMSATTGLRAAVINAASIGVGASVGREGPAVHLGAWLGSWLAKRLRLTPALSRTLLGCGVAAAVAASFNAPIAGALFANEVVLRHYALKTFAPVVIASVAGTVVSRAYFGDFPAFIIAPHIIASLWEFPAFAGLGIAAGIVAAVFMHGIALSEKTARKLPIPPWLRPAVGGLLIGAMALAFPQVLGIGYGATEAALAVAFPLSVLIAVGVAKMAATAISLGFGFGGGVFSPSLVIGAMLGGAYGIVATLVFPDLSSGPGAYTLVGMAAVAAAVLGAPISTALIIFEMTGDYALTVAVMVAVVVASVTTQQLYGRSFFMAQLERRGIDLKVGVERALLRTLKVSEVMSRENDLVTSDVGLPLMRVLLQRSATGALFVVRENGEFLGSITLADLSEVAFDQGVDNLIFAGDVVRRSPAVLAAGDDLETALALIRETGETHIPVVGDMDSMTFSGTVHERDVLDAYNRALLQTRREERGE